MVSLSHVQPWCMRFFDRVGRNVFPGKVLCASVTDKIIWDGYNPKSDKGKSYDAQKKEL